jgi:hypothetical protein
MEEITIRLSDYAKKVLFEQLNISGFKDVIDIDYKSTGNIDKSKTRVFQRLLRGSIRIINGRYRTQEEKEERIKEFQKLRLP